MSDLDFANPPAEIGGIGDDGYASKSGEPVPMAPVLRHDEMCMFVAWGESEGGLRQLEVPSHVRRVVRRLLDPRVIHEHLNAYAMGPRARRLDANGLFDDVRRLGYGFWSLVVQSGPADETRSVARKSRDGLASVASGPVSRN